MSQPPQTPRSPATPPEPGIPDSPKGPKDIVREEAAKEAGKQIAQQASDKFLGKVYDDLLHEGVQQVGDRLGRVVRISLSPVDALLWPLEAARDWLAREVPKRLLQRGVPEDRIVPPSPQVSVHTIHGVQFAGPMEDSMLREMYAALLATAMDAHTASLAHPAFAEMIRQLTPREARLLIKLSLAETRAVAVRIEWYVHRENEIPRMQWGSYAIDHGVAASAQELWLQADNLRRLGVLEYEEVTNRYPQDFTDTTIRSQVEALLAQAHANKPMNAQRAREIKVQLLHVTEFGLRFVATCAPADPQSAHDAGERPQVG